MNDIYGPFKHLDPQLEQLAPNPFCSPHAIHFCLLAGEIDRFRRDVGLLCCVLIPILLEAKHFPPTSFQKWQLSFCSLSKL
jgi:hypothetical protein